MKTLPIDKAVPITDFRVSSRHPLKPNPIPLADMQTGDSVFVPADVMNYNTVQGRIQQARVRNPTILYATRTVKNPTKGTRVWRLV